MVSQLRGLVNWRVGSAFGALALLSACGGGSGGGGGISSTPLPQPTPTPVPAPTPTPSPTPTPTPPPTTNFNTAEFQRSSGPAQHGAVSAWQRGATGDNVTIAIVDTGIDSDSPEFAGRIHPGSRDVVANRGIEQEDDHGTNVALVAAAARNGAGVVGIAFDADLLVLRTDSVGSCGTDTPDDTSLGCSFFDSDIARAIDVAVTNGAKVVNLSLGGGRPSRATLDAVRRASQAGVVIVVAAGNGGEGDVAGTDPNQPTAFASGLRAAGGDNVIIVGSVGETGTISSFSQRAGLEANFVLNARGERVCCVYENGEIFIKRDASGSFRLLFSGTSFAAPQVAGAVALLAQAFPNLTGRQIVDLLLRTARDAGDPGTDAIYGRGILDIAAAFSPVGMTKMAGGVERVYLGNDTGVGSPAMGDAFVAGTQSANGIVLDEYQRAFEYDFGAGLRGAVPQFRLHSMLDARTRHVATGTEALSLAFTIAQSDPTRDAAGRPSEVGQLRLTSEQAEGARVLAARVAMRIDPKTELGFAMREGAHGLAAQLQDADRPAFLIAGAAGDDTGFARGAEMSVALRREIAGTGLTLSAESGEAWLGNYRHGVAAPIGRRESFPTRSFSLAADRTIGPLDTVFGLTWLQEDRTVLGGYFDQAFGVTGADTLFLDASAGLDLGDRWKLGAAFRQGHTRIARSGLVAGGSDFTSRGWSVDLSRSDFLRSGDRMGLRLSQPLRVTGGGLNLDLPVSYDYATLTPGYGRRHIAFSPSGRELVGEAAWRGPLWSGDASASIYYRTQPGHYVAAPDDAGVAFSWRKAF